MPDRKLFLLEQRRLGSSFQAGEGLLPQIERPGKVSLPLKSQPEGEELTAFSYEKHINFITWCL